MSRKCSAKEWEKAHQLVWFEDWLKWTYIAQSRGISLPIELSRHCEESRLPKKVLQIMPFPISEIDAHKSHTTQGIIYVRNFTRTESNTQLYFFNRSNILQYNGWSTTVVFIQSL
jgi:hypothetical protein